MSLIPAAGGAFDASQFKLQADGTFRISMRGMAAMAGVDHAGIVRSLRSAGDENALPCARSLLAQGFSPGDVSTWGETGGIPEDAAPFILEYYGFNATSPSAQARAVLLAFSRVGINAYLKECLGVPQVRDTRSPSLPGNGFVNATAMCKANNKRWSDYRESDRCQQYLDALAQITEIPVFDLIQSRRGLDGGTWVHPQVAVDLARWISAPFAVWVDAEANVMDHLELPRW